MEHGRLANHGLRPGVIRSHAATAAAHERRPRRCLALALLAALPALAHATHDPERLRELIEQGHYGRAYTLASDQVAAHAGQVGFDFYYGLAAIETGHLSEAAFALERVLMHRPELDRARLELARTLYLQGDDRRAREAFEIVLAHTPPPAVVAGIERYLAAMDRRADRYHTTITGWLEAELGHDDNANRAPAVDTIDLGQFTVLLDESQQARGSAYARAAGDLQVSRPLHPGLNVIAGIGGEARSLRNASEYDTRLGAARLGLRQIAGAHRLAAYVQGHQFRVDGEGYQSATGLSGSWLYQLDQRSAVQGSAQRSELSYDTQPVRDSTLTALSLGLSTSWNGPLSPSASLGATVGEQEPDEDSQQARALASRSIVGLAGRVALSPAAQWILETTLQYRRSEYETYVWPFPEAREDNYYSLDLTLDWYPNAHWRVGPRLNYSKNDANIELYDYQRTAIGVRARYAF